MSGTDPSVAQFTDVPLMERVARREETAVAEFYRTYAAGVLRFLYPRVGEVYEDAEEVLQDVFLSAVSLASTYDGSSGVFTWLCGIARLRLVDFYRRWSSQKGILAAKVLPMDEEALQALQEFEAGGCPVEQAVRRMDAARLVDAMSAVLTAREREIFLLHYIDEFTVPEIAELLQRAPKTVENLLTRARKKAAAAGTRWLERGKTPASV